MVAAAPALRGPRGLRRWLRLVRGIAVLAFVVGAWTGPAIDDAAPAREAVAVAVASDAAAPSAEITVQDVAARPVEPTAHDASAPALAGTASTAVDVIPRGADRSSAGVRAPPR